jgi:hypothetical protein
MRYRPLPIAHDRSYSAPADNMKAFLNWVAGAAMVMACPLTTAAAPASPTFTYENPLDFSYP